VPLNQPCILAIRPEHVVLANANDNLENALPATVAKSTFRRDLQHKASMPTA